MTFYRYFLTHMDCNEWTHLLICLLETTVAIRCRILPQLHLILVFLNHLHTLFFHFERSHQLKLVSRVHLVFCLPRLVLIPSTFSQLVLALLHAPDTQELHELLLASCTESHTSQFSFISHSNYFSTSFSINPKNS